jgi:hypothetical protein
MRPNITKKHAVALSMMANSFYDPDCGANLFKSSPVYQFNHKPTQSIVSAIKGGSLVDLVGNIVGEVEAVSTGAVDTKAIEAQVRANVEAEIKAKLEAEYKAKLEAEVAKVKAEAKEEVKEEKVEEVVEEKETKAASNKKK